MPNFHGQPTAQPFVNGLYFYSKQPSSSSISTTTSSVTSMTSLEHEDGSRGNDSVSDYDYDHWGDNDWGDMETHGQMASSSGSAGGDGTSDPISPPSHSGQGKVTDGWDNEEWGSLEEEQEAEGDMTSPSEVWSPSDTTPILPEPQRDTRARSPKKPSGSNQDGWDKTEFEPLEENPGSNPKLEEAKKKREERKLMRQKELEARRASKTLGGPMKLGSKKL